MLWDGVGLRELPARADVDDGVHYSLALLVHEGERRSLVGDGQRELVLVHQADLLDLRGVINIVEDHVLTQDPGTVGRGHLDGTGAYLKRRRYEQELTLFCHDV